MGTCRTSDLLQPVGQEPSTQSTAAANTPSFQCVCICVCVRARARDHFHTHPSHLISGPHAFLMTFSHLKLGFGFSY